MKYFIFIMVLKIVFHQKLYADQSHFFIDQSPSQGDVSIDDGANSDPNYLSSESNFQVNDGNTMTGYVSPMENPDIINNPPILITGLIKENENIYIKFDTNDPNVSKVQNCGGTQEYRAKITKIGKFKFLVIKSYYKKPESIDGNYACTMRLLLKSSREVKISKSIFDKLTTGKIKVYNNIFILPFHLNRSN